MRVVSIEGLRKAGPFIGPRGGKWKDAKHTIPYEGNVKRALYHAAPANVMHKIKDEGLTASAGGSLYQQGHYQEHSAGKVHLADNPQAGRHWHENTERQLEAQHDDPKDHDAVLLRVKYRRTALDPVGDKDVPGSRYTRKDIDPGDLEYHDKKHGWRPVEHWQPGSHSLPTDEQAEQPGREAHRIREQRKQLEASRAESRKRSQEQADKWAAEEDALDKEWSAKPAAEREAKAKELAAKRSPIPGMTQLKDRWQKRLGVDAKGNLLKAFYKKRVLLNSGLTKAGPFIGPKGGKWADAKHTVPWGYEGEHGGREHVHAVAKHLAEQHGAKVSLMHHNGETTVSGIAVPKDKRGQGAGDAIMAAIERVADKHGHRVTLTPDPTFGNNKGSKARLTKWYKRRGFVENKGKHKDYEVSESMYREPIKKAAHKLHRRRKWNGLQISVETQAGAWRYWTDSDGTTGRTKMKYDYGYIRGTLGVDGDHVDVFVGPNEHATHVYIVHQRKGGDFRRFDEQKCMLGSTALNRRRSRTCDTSTTCASWARSSRCRWASSSRRCCARGTRRPSTS